MLFFLYLPKRRCDLNAFGEIVAERTIMLIFEMKLVAITSELKEEGYLLQPCPTNDFASRITNDSGSRKVLITLGHRRSSQFLFSLCSLSPLCYPRHL